VPALQLRVPRVPLDGERDTTQGGVELARLRLGRREPIRQRSTTRTSLRAGATASTARASRSAAAGSPALTAAAARSAPTPGPPSPTPRNSASATACSPRAIAACARRTLASTAS
jgi:hypothetical protein